MPNRILRDWTDSESIEQIDVHAERFFTRLIMKVDDFGRYNANMKLLKSHLFPLKSDIREADISRWLTACEKSGLIVTYTVANKEYLQIENFKQTLRQKNEKYPPPNICHADAAQMNSICEHETKRKETETETKLNPPSGDEIEPFYKKLDKSLESVHAFIRDNSPVFIEPYVDLWNFFAAKYKMAGIKTVTDNRKKKFNVRIRDKNFDFIFVLAKAKQSEFLLNGNWFGFDWIIENDSNYLKVIEGSYANKKEGESEKLKGANVNDKIKSVLKNGSNKPE